MEKSLWYDLRIRQRWANTRRIFSSKLRRLANKLATGYTVASRTANVRARHLISDRRAYEYTPLRSDRSIRLLMLHLGREDSIMEITMKEVSINDDMKYDALSYTWADENGNYELSSMIMCHQACIAITPNCEAALRRFSDPNLNINLLWIDAICINQSDIEERNQQVRLMREIYSRSRRVLVWLGHASMDLDPETSYPYSDIAVEFVKQVGIDAKRVSSKSVTFHEACEHKLLFAKAPVGTWTRENTPPLLWGLYNLFNRRWWERVWVLQELACAPAALAFCGNQIVDFKDFEALLDCTAREDAPYTGLDFVLGLAFAKLLIKREFGTNNCSTCVDTKELGSTFLRCLELTRVFGASDKRDKVFGIIGLFENLGRILPQSDYNKSTARVYTEVARAILASTRSLDLLCHCYAILEDPNLPSWVPDWSLSDRQPSWMDFDATKGSEATYREIRDTALLQVRGKAVSIVDVVISFAKSADCCSMASYEIDAVRVWSQFSNLVSLSGAYPTGEHWKEVVGQTLCYSVRAKRLYSLGSWHSFDAWHNILEAGPDTPTDKIRAWLASDDARPCYSRALHNIIGKSVCRTSDGYVVLAPDTVQLNDKIFLLAGARAPFVLRPTDDYFKVIGPCYVHGIMYGEAFRADESELQWITLR